MFTALIGDLFASRAQTLVNTVNCVGVMGKGVALEFKRRYPRMFEDYALRCDRGEVRLGEPYLYTDLSGVKIINFPTKDHWRSPSRLADIERGLDFLVAQAGSWGVTGVALPPLGCGNGGLEWSEVGPLIYGKLHAMPWDIEVYAPYGTPKTELTEEFLAAPSQLSLQGQGRRPEKLNPEWAVLIEVLRQLQRQPYVNPVGRTIFQKIAYVLTETGVKTGFQFDRGSYGPFTEELKRALHELANRNWLREKQLGRMTALLATERYEADRSRFSEVLRRHEKKIAKTVDLFSRIKDTEQAEEVATVLFACRQVKRSHPGEDVQEQEILDYILTWKKAWAAEEKQRKVGSAIRHLVMLGWMKLGISEGLPVAG